MFFFKDSIELYSALRIFLVGVMGYLGCCWHLTSLFLINGEFFMIRFLCMCVNRCDIGSRFAEHIQIMQSRVTNHLSSKLTCQGQLCHVHVVYTLLYIMRGYLPIFELVWACNFKLICLLIFIVIIVKVYSFNVILQP